MSSKLSKNLASLPVPPKENLTSHFTLGEIIDHIDVLQEEFPRVKIPLLKSHLWSIRNKDVNPEIHLRGFLKVFEETDVFKDAFNQLDEGMKRQLKVFIAGGSGDQVLLAGTQHDGAFALPPSPPVKHHFQALIQKVDSFFNKNEKTNGLPNGETNGVVHAPVKQLSRGTPQEGFPRIYEDEAETKTMEVHGDKEFQNWGQSVLNTPLWTFVPKTVLGLQNLVKWAKINDYRVRCAGYRHSWSSSFSQNKQILVSLLNLEEVNKLPDPMSIEPEYIDPQNELKTITLAASPGVVVSSADKALVRVGVSVTNEQFRRWAIANDKWTMPVDVILVEVTWGGVNGPICHGAGRVHQTVNDYVRAVEYVDANAIHRTVSDPEHLKAAAGHFGLLGIVTHITFELDKMRYAVMKPVKPDIGLAIPPMSRDDIPIALRKTYTQAQYDTALLDFENRASNDYYAEWFWFTRSQQAWVNTWNPVEDKGGLQDYPSPLLTWFQWVEGWLGAVITGNPIFQAIPGRWQAEILATFGMVNLPPFEFSDFQQEKTETIKTALPNALHFRRGVRCSSLVLFSPS
jgi:hypothetical protein